MSPVAVSLQQILDLASHYSPRSTPDMRKRAEIGNDLAAELGNVLPGLTVSLGLTDLGLRTEPGGRQGSFSPIPWVRVYSPDYAPSAQAGIYLVYLFAADGSRAYLSLMPGTSEFRSGQMRAITDTRVLLARGGEGRSALGDLIESPGAAGASLSIDLGSAGLRSHDSRVRARAYELATILAREYVSGAIPDDGQLVADLAGMLPLLAHLYGRDITPGLGGFQPPSPVNGGGQPARLRPMAGQGLLMDQEVRKKIEVWAEDRAIEHFTGLGWTTIKRVGHIRPYDLECQNEAGEVLHVEVKGTQSRGEKVELTDGEVRHNRNTADCPADYHAFYELARINVSPEGEITRTGEEEVTCILPWAIDEEHDLAPVKYTYTVPTA
jgi:MrcB-like, N-terminal domain/Domain of unknown function (DUF3883)